MLIKQSNSYQPINFMKKSYAVWLLVMAGLAWHASSLHAVPVEQFTYYLYIADFADSFIEIPTSNVSGESSTISSTYLAGRAAIYDQSDIQVGTCSASFLCMQNEDGIYNDISNYLTSEDGMIVTWFTPTTLRNLELDSIIHSMVTECIVTVTTKVGVAPLYDQTFSLIVSSDDEKISFKFTRIRTIF
jgi:hypothetical protein